MTLPTPTDIPDMTPSVASILSFVDKHPGAVDALLRPKPVAKRPEKIHDESRCWQHAGSRNEDETTPIYDSVKADRISAAYGKAQPLGPDPEPTNYKDFEDFE